VCSMAVPAARRGLVGSVPKSPFRRGFLLARAPCSFLSPPREQQEAARLPLANPSDPCPWLDPRHGRLTIPISTAVEALQSNEVYLPRIRQRLDPALSARQINAIR
jgi:hypothetical protein